MNIPYNNRRTTESTKRREEEALMIAAQNKALSETAILDATSQYPEFMTVEQVAEALQLSNNTVRSLLQQHVIPGKKLSHKWIIPREALAKALIEA